MPYLEGLRTDQSRPERREQLYLRESRAVRQASYSGKDTLLPSDNTVSAFWITNPDNSFIDNVAAGSDANGFWLSLPEHPQGAFLGTDTAQNVWPRRTKFREFRNNTAHSNFDGFMFDRNINAENIFGWPAPRTCPGKTLLT